LPGLFDALGADKTGIVGAVDNPAAGSVVGVVDVAAGIVGQPVGTADLLGVGPGVDRKTSAALFFLQTVFVASWSLANGLELALVTVPGLPSLLAPEPALVLGPLLEFSPLLERVLRLELLLLPGLLLPLAPVLPLGPLLLPEPVPVPEPLPGFVPVDIDTLAVVKSGRNLARYCVDPGCFA